VFAVGDLHGHDSGQAAQLIGAGVGGDRDGRLLPAALDDAGVMEDEAAAASVERSSDFSMATWTPQPWALPALSIWAGPVASRTP
jgi:hypothetical protein